MAQITVIGAFYLNLCFIFLILHLLYKYNIFIYNYDINIYHIYILNSILIEMNATIVLRSHDQF